MQKILNAKKGGQCQRSFPPTLAFSTQALSLEETTPEYPSEDTPNNPTSAACTHLYKESKLSWNIAFLHLMLHLGDISEHMYLVLFTDLASSF